MTNLEKVKSMSKEELSNLLNHFMDGFDECVVNVWFTENYCKNICPDIRVIYEGKNEIWKECDFEGKCFYQNCGSDIVKLWLDAESE